MEKITHLSDIQKEMNNLSQQKPQTQEEIEEWLTKIQNNFSETVDMLNNIFNNKIIKNEETMDNS